MSDVAPEAWIESATLSAFSPGWPDEQAVFDARLVVSAIAMCRPASVLRFGLGDGWDAMAAAYALAAGRATPRALFVADWRPDHDVLAAVRSSQPSVRVELLRHRHCAPARWVKWLLKGGQAFDMAHLGPGLSRLDAGRTLELASRVVRPGGYCLVSGYASDPPIRRAVLDYVMAAGPAHLYAQSARGQFLIQFPFD